MKRALRYMIDDDLAAWLKAEAARRHCSMSQILRDLIVEAREKRERTSQKHHGIQAVLNRGVKGLYGRDSARTLFFATEIQATVEMAMSALGYGCDQYHLLYGELTTTKDTK